MRDAARSGRTDEPGHRISSESGKGRSLLLADREPGGTAWYRLTRDNWRRPKEAADVGVTRSTAGRWRTEAQGSHCREGGAGHHRAVR
jgi:hypothetical protein